MDDGTTRMARARLAAQGLTRPPGDDTGGSPAGPASGSPAQQAAEAVGRLLAVQAQDPRGMRLAVRARTRGLTAADVDTALGIDRALVVTWLNRGTLHLVRAADYWWLQDLTAPRMAAQIRRRLREEGVPPDDAERGVDIIVRALAEHGPLGRTELRERVAASGVPTAGQAMVYLLIVAATRGLIVRGPMTGTEHAYVRVADWLEPPARPLDRDVALAELARRYLLAHGPADESNLAAWAGLPLRDARRGLTAIADDAMTDDNGRWTLLASTDPADPPPGPCPPRLLGPFDPVLHGWVDRTWIGADGRTITSNGIFRPVILVEGRAVGTWRLPAGRVTLEPFTDPPDWPPAVATALTDETTDVHRFLAPGPSSNPGPSTGEAPGDREAPAGD